MAGPLSPSLPRPPVPANVVMSPSGVDLADAVVAAVGNIDVASRVGSHSGGVAESSLRGGASVPAVSFLARAGERGNHAGGVDPADPLIPRVDHVNIAGRVQGKAARESELCPRGRAPVPAVTFSPCAREGVDHTDTLQSDPWGGAGFTARTHWDREHVLSCGGSDEEQHQAR